MREGWVDGCSQREVYTREGPWNSCAFTMERDSMLQNNRASEKDAAKKTRLRGL